MLYYYLLYYIGKIILKNEIFELNFNISDETTTITPLIIGDSFKKLRVEFYNSSNKIIKSYIDTENNQRGPNYQLIDNFINMPIKTAVFSEEEWWPLVLIIVACCVEVEVGSGGWSVGFDCDCLSSKTVTANLNGKSYDLDKIKFVPLDSNNNPINLSPKNWTLSTN